MDSGRIATTLTALVVGALVLSGQTGVAHAASQAVTEDCYSNASQTIPVTLEVGETFTITTGSSTDCLSVRTDGPTTLPVGVATVGPNGTENPVAYNSPDTVINPGDKILFIATSVGTIQFQLTDSRGDYIFFAITVRAADNSSGDGPAPSGPEDVLQQVGKPAGECDFIQDPQLNWSGVSSGGWSESWAQWANNGRGGSVCTRTLAYSVSTSAWFVRP